MAALAVGRRARPGLSAVRIIASVIREVQKRYQIGWVRRNHQILPENPGRFRYGAGRQPRSRRPPADLRESGGKVPEAGLVCPRSVCP